jgi:hypothetical protein
MNCTEVVANCPVGTFCECTSGMYIPEFTRQLILGVLVILGVSILIIKIIEKYYIREP